MTVDGPTPADTATADKTAFLAAVSASLGDGTFLKAALGKFRGTGIEQRCTITRVELKDGPRLRLVTRRGTQEVTENIAFAVADSALAPLLGETYLSATLFTTTADVALVYSKKRVPRLTRTRPSLTAAPSTAHDRAKETLVAVDASYLVQLGITHSAKPGRAAEVKPSMYAKFRQINRFIEILDQLIASSIVRDTAAPSIVDIGAGKGYLTFALHDHLLRAGKQPATLGIEANAGLVQQCSAVVSACGLTGLSFAAARAESQAPASLDILIALHACDTATDDAIHLGIRSNAALIVCAPCCQHEISPQLQPGSSPIDGILKFGLLKQRQADLVTDAARALLLEANGYEVRIIEFVSTEHTAKNLLIAAVRTGRTDRSAARDQLAQLQQLFGFSHHKLQDALERSSGEKSGKE